MTANIVALLILFLITLLSPSCHAQSNTKNKNLQEAKKAIAESNAIYFESFAKNDSSIFITRYAEDACIMAPFAPPSCGRGNVAKFFREAYDRYGLRDGNFITTAVYGDANEYVTEEGLWQSINDKGEIFDQGKFLVLWKKTKDGWKMFRDSFSSDRKKGVPLTKTRLTKSGLVADSFNYYVGLSFLLLALTSAPCL
jgi:ketosteroid isomerase-like protein